MWASSRKAPVQTDKAFRNKYYVDIGDDVATSSSRSGDDRIYAHSSHFHLLAF